MAPTLCAMTLVIPVETVATKTCARHVIALAFATCVSAKFLSTPKVPKANTILEAMCAMKIITSPAKGNPAVKGNKK